MKHSFSMLKIKNTSTMGTINSDWVGEDGVKESWGIILDMLLEENVKPEVYNKIKDKVQEFRKDIKTVVS